jgi:uncharacterized membrane protein
MDGLNAIPIVADSERRHQTEGGRRYISRDRAMVAIALLYGATVLLLGWYRHTSYRSRTFDLAVFDQALWLMADGHAPFVTVIGRNVFTDHFSPALALFVPLYAVASSAFWLIAAQAVALAIGFLALGPLFDELKLSKAWRWAFSVAYLVSPLLWRAALFDFHMSTLAVPFLVVGLTASVRDDVRRLVFIVLALLLIRDDLGLAAIALLLLNFSGTKHRLQRVGLCLFALAWVVIAGRYGQAIDSPELWRAHYGYLGPTAADALKHPARAAAGLLDTIWSGGNLATVVTWLIPLGFLPLLSPTRLALAMLWALPLLASARLSTSLLPSFHYGAVILPFLFFAAAISVVRFKHRLVEFAGPWCLLVFSASSLWIANPFEAWIFRTPTPPSATVSAALQHIEPTDGVTATATLGPHLSHRALLLPFPYPFMRGDEPAQVDLAATEVSAEAVARIDAIAIYLPAPGTGAEVRDAFLRLPSLDAFQLVFARDDLLIFRRVLPPPQP